MGVGRQAGRQPRTHPGQARVTGVHRGGRRQGRRRWGRQARQGAGQATTTTHHNKAIVTGTVPKSQAGTKITTWQAEKGVITTWAEPPQP